MQRLFRVKRDRMVVRTARDGEREEWDLWLEGSTDKAIALQRPLPNDALRGVVTGEKSDRTQVDE
jgi:putative SOS response-associated peptidase YedK